MYMFVSKSKMFPITFPDELTNSFHIRASVEKRLGMSGIVRNFHLLVLEPILYSVEPAQQNGQVVREIFSSGSIG